MKYHAFYIDNNLLIRIINKETTSFKKHDNVVALYNENQIIGYNILEYSNDKLNSGLVKLNQEITNDINNELKKHDLELLTYDDKCYFVVGYVESIEDHPHSDKLKICQVDVKDEKLQIVCGGINIAENIKVVVAKDNAILSNGTWIEKGQVMKVKSEGMICNKKELNMVQEKPGILILDDSYQVGDCFV